MTSDITTVTDHMAHSPSFKWVLIFLTTYIDLNPDFLFFLIQLKKSEVFKHLPQ